MLYICRSKLNVYSLLEAMEAVDSASDLFFKEFDLDFLLLGFKFLVTAVLLFNVRVLFAFSIPGSSAGLAMYGVTQCEGIFGGCLGRVGSVACWRFMLLFSPGGIGYGEKGKNPSVASHRH